jgi:hypothetical protein
MVKGGELLILIRIDAVETATILTASASFGEIGGFSSN